MSSPPRDPFAGEPAPGSGASELADRQRRIDARLGDSTFPSGIRRSAPTFPDAPVPRALHQSQSFERWHGAGGVALGLARLHEQLSDQRCQE